MTRSLLVKLSAAAVVISSAAAAARADVTIKQRRSGAQAQEETIYLKGSMQRRDVKAVGRDGRAVTWADITDCARQQFVWLDTTNRRYTAQTGGLPDAALAAFDEQQFPARVPPRSKGTLTKIVEVTDTGGRREMFGFDARRLRIVTTYAAAPDACDARAARVEAEGWYVDLLHGLDCSPDLSGATPRWHGFVFAFDGDSCLGRRLRRGYLPRLVSVGGGRLGYPLAETTRVFDERGRVTTHTVEVTELSTAALDDALFAVPAGYTRVEPGRKGKASALSIFR